ncbi:ABC transporter ATP-binding protein [Candidatus Collierbacteria bacterium]|nr:ABC transporter ATP-binding protein [Candidatus Collierbacteria bacterium]
MTNATIHIAHVSKSFHVGVQDVPVLRDISFEVYPNDFCVIFGPSGCGKSTLLHTILGLEAPSAGTCTFLSQNLYEGMDEDERSDFRKNHVGMVYQQPNWIKSLTVLENVAFPLILMGKPKGESLEKANAMLEVMGMRDWSGYAPTELSSGQQQKVALVRALVTNPEVIIADEPTGNLDFESGQELMQLLVTLNKEQAKTVLMVTHDLEYLKFAKTVVKMFDGAIAGEYAEKDKETLLKEIKGKRGNGNIICQR